MGEIVHRICLNLVKQGLLCGGKVTNQLATANTLKSKTVQEIDR